jgi:hypothetical protein
LKSGAPNGTIAMFNLARQFCHQSDSWRQALYASIWLDNSDSSSWEDGDWISNSWGAECAHSGSAASLTSWRGRQGRS